MNGPARLTVRVTVRLPVQTFESVAVTVNVKAADLCRRSGQHARRRVEAQAGGQGPRVRPGDRPGAARLGERLRVGGRRRSRPGRGRIDRDRGAGLATVRMPVPVAALAVGVGDGHVLGPEWRPTVEMLSVTWVGLSNVTEFTVTLPLTDAAMWLAKPGPPGVRARVEELGSRDGGAGDDHVDGGLARRHRGRAGRRRRGRQPAPGAGWRARPRCWSRWRTPGTSTSSGRRWGPRPSASSRPSARCRSTKVS